MSKKLKLFAGLLGQVPKGEVVENHKLEFVVAENEEEAKKQLLQKWPMGDVHLDGMKEINEVDGHRILISN
jgi:hypothetical protein